MVNLNHQSTTSLIAIKDQMENTNITTQASLTTRIKVWWDTIPLFTRSIFAICVFLFLLQCITGEPNVYSVCFSPYGVLTRNFKYCKYSCNPCVNLSSLYIFC